MCSQPPRDQLCYTGPSSSSHLSCSARERRRKRRYEKLYLLLAALCTIPSFAKAGGAAANVTGADTDMVGGNSSASSTAQPSAAPTTLAPTASPTAGPTAVPSTSPTNARYKCRGVQCVRAADGEFPSTTCNGTCDGTLPMGCKSLVRYVGCDASLSDFNPNAKSGATIRTMCPENCHQYYTCQGAKCVPSSTGEFESTRCNSTCRSPCAHGHEYNFTARKCTACAAGRHYSGASHHCEDCPKGSHQDADGANLCYACPMGKYAEQPGQTECTLCPEDTTTCELKPTLFGIQEECHTNATSIKQCTCRGGMLANPRKPGHCLNCTFGGTCCLCRETAACYDHKYGSCNFSKLFANFEKYNSPCAPGKCFSGSYRAMPKPGFFLDTPKCHYNCTDNTDVENDTKVFVEAAQAQEDWWGSPDEPHVLFACSVLNAGLKQAHALSIPFREQGCYGGPNSSCAPGHHGRLCALCEPNWYMTPDHICKVCSDPAASRTFITWFFFIIIFVGIPGAYVGLYIMVADKNSSQWLVYFRLLVDHMQLLSINTGIKTSWPWHMQTIFKVSDSANMNFDYLELECGFGFDYTAKYFIFLGLPVLFFVEMILITLFMRCLAHNAISAHKEAQAEKIRSRSNRIVPPGELETIMDAFAHVDHDKNGYINAHELGDLIHEIEKGGHSETEYEVHEILHELDQDHDGRVHPEEFIEWYRLNVDSGGEVHHDDANVLAKKNMSKMNLLIGTISDKTGGLMPNVPSTEQEWETFKDHIIQIFVMSLLFMYVTLAKYGISIFDCFRQPNDPSSLFLDDAPSITCLDSTKWWILSAVGGWAIVAYIIGVPVFIAIISFKNHYKVRMGNMKCLQRYGFLYKVYKPEKPFWEVVILIRKGCLVCISRLQTNSPYTQCVLSMCVYSLVLVFQASIRPYRQARHNNASEFLLVGNMVTVFSSIIFTSESSSDTMKEYVLYINLAILLPSWAYMLIAQGVDAYLYGLLQLYSSYVAKESVAGCDPNIDDYYFTVDPTGIVSPSYYDMLVLRNRYYHNVRRRLPRRRWNTEGQFITETNDVARDHFDRFHEHLADFILRVDKSKISDAYPGKFRERADPSDPNKQVRCDLSHLKPTVKFLGELYSKSKLCYMILYLEHAIKFDYYKKHKLDEVGPGDCVEQILGFAEDFVGDAARTFGGCYVKRGSTDESDKGKRVAIAEKRGRRLLIQPNRLLGHDLEQLMMKEQILTNMMKEMKDQMRNMARKQAKLCDDKVSDEQWVAQMQAANCARGICMNMSEDEKYRNGLKQAFNVKTTKQETVKVLNPMLMGEENESPPTTPTKETLIPDSSFDRAGVDGEDEEARSRTSSPDSTSTPTYLSDVGGAHAKMGKSGDHSLGREDTDASLKKEMQRLRVRRDLDTIDERVYQVSRRSVDRRMRDLKARKEAERDSAVVGGVAGMALKLELAADLKVETPPGSARTGGSDSPRAFEFEEQAHAPPSPRSTVRRRRDSVQLDVSIAASPGSASPEQVMV